MVTGAFSLPDRETILPCVDPDGREFTGRVRGLAIDEGHLSISIEVVGSETTDTAEVIDDG